MRKGGTGRRPGMWPIVVCGLAACLPASAQQTRPATADATMPLLAGRLTIRVPAGSRAEARPHPITAAPAAEESETRLLLGDGPGRVIVLARESFALAGDDFTKDVRTVVDGWEAGLRVRYLVEPRPVPAPGLRAVSVRPAAPPDRGRSPDATFLQGMFVALPDGTVQTVDVYADPEAAKDLAVVNALAGRTLQTLAPGTRALNIAAGDRKLIANPGGEPDLVVTVPKGVAVSTDSGPDFVVHRLRVLDRLGRPPTMLGLYLGDHPNFKPGPAAGEGVLLGKAISWQRVPSGEGLEALVENPLGDAPPRYAHAWLVSDPAHLAPLNRVASTLRAAPGAAPKKP